MTGFEDAAARVEPNSAAANRERESIRVCEPMKQGLQFLFVGPPPLQVISQPAHNYRDPRLNGYISAAMVQRRGQSAVLPFPARSLDHRMETPK